jgi:hypothetical protein
MQSYQIEVEMFDFKMSGLCNKETRGLLKLNISTSK